jgi:hypothetical protein
MSVLRQHGQIVFECDACGDTHESGTTDFHDAYADAKDAGWVSFKNDEGDWEHRCEACKGRS